MNSTLRMAILGVAIAYLVVAGTEVYLHWYAGTQNTPTAHAFKKWYSAPDAQNGKEYHAGYVDLIIPAIFLGLGAGLVTARQPPRVLTWSGFFLGLGIIALIPFYAAITPTKGSDAWWTLASSGELAMAFVPGYFKAAMLCLFLGGVGRVLAQRFCSIIPDS